MTPRELEERFLAALAALAGGLERKFVCAFSGGVDSTALLALLTAALPPERILAAHLNHNLRPQAKAEAAQARALALSLKAPFVEGEAQIKALAETRGRGLEEAGRRARYDFLAQTLSDWGGDFILTAHQANDQAETILLKIFRGGGPSSLAGVRPARGQVLRPLLAFSRADLAAYVESRGLVCVNDPSNEDPNFRRNHLRLKIWPLLLEQNSALVAALGRAARIAWAEEDFWEEKVTALAQSLAETLPDGRIRARAAELGELPLASRRRLAFRLLSSADAPAKGGGGVPLAGVDRFLDFLAESRPNGQGVDLPGGRRVERQGIYLYIGPSSRFTPSSS
jgi:tRNA(Ile)-lysidine synthase